jgi:type VII secretion integral membrane protein EccD
MIRGRHSSTPPTPAAGPGASPPRRRACVRRCSVALTWSGVVAHAIGHVVTAGAIAAATAIGAVVVRRVHSDALHSITLSTVAAVFGSAAGFLAVPAGPSTPRLLLAAAVGCSVSTLLLRVTRCGAICLTALATSSGLTGAASAAGVAGTLPVATTGAVLATLSLGALGMAPRLSIAAAGLAPGVFAAAPPQALSAHRVLTGLVMGSAAAMAFGVLLVALAGGRDGHLSAVLFVAAVALAAMLRARSHVDVFRRTALVASGMATVAVGCGIVVIATPERANWVCLFVTAVGVGVMAGAPGAVVNPLAHRTMEMFEYLALAAVIPLACWVGGVYGLVRGVSLS